jgi:DNA-binding IclR family transcriptional regulator
MRSLCKGFHVSELSDSVRDSGGVQVIARAAAILRALGSKGTSLGTLARATGLPRSTVQRIVDALAAENFVEIGEDGVSPGWGLQQLAQIGRSNVVARVRPFLEALFDRTHETVDISVRSGREVAFLDRIISDQELRAVPIIDRPSPLHAMANGKAILSCMSDTQVADLVGRHLMCLTPATRSDLSDLLADLAEVRRTGFAYDSEEHASGVCALGTPVNVPGLRPHALSIAVPSTRFEARLPDYKAALQDCRRTVEAELSRTEQKRTSDKPRVSNRRT